jgi:hypothetical protein
MRKIYFLLVLLVLFLLPASVFAALGVGVGTGKIQVDQKLYPGTIYTLPSLTVLNTGDEPSDYEVTVGYHEKQPELKPLLEWFDFSPKKFNLEPGKAQAVDIKINLPVNAQPGDYFAYLEGQPVAKSNTGGTTVGIAAAAKLYFTVSPANFLQGIYYKITSFWKVNQPWSGRIAIFAAVVLILYVAKKYLKVQVNLKKPENGSKSEPKSE